MATYQARGRKSRLIVAFMIILVFLVGGGVGVLVGRALPHSAAAKPTTPPTTGTRAPPSSGSSTTTAPPLALGLIAVTPANGAKGVAADAPITVTFSAPLASSSPAPILDPTPAGSWRASGASFTFTPSTDLSPLSVITLTLPGGPEGILGAGGGRLAQSQTEHFEVANGSVTRIQQLLSLLDYSPLSFEPSGRAISPSDTGAQIAALYHPPAGSYAWRNQGWPARLRAMWQEGADNVFTRGLIMSFQADHSLIPNGTVGASLWTALLAALAANTVNTGGYNYALANKATPESLTVYHDGRVAVETQANTGIAASPTPDGTFPVYTRLRRQVMRGTNPNGQHYADLVQYIAYFNGNDAVHYMDRADYGIPQSLGCIELPLASAKRVWPYLAYGTLVTIIN
jgi:hypothetical protein